MRLAKGKSAKAAALQAFHKLMAGEKRSTITTITAATLCDLYLDWSREEHKPSTQEWYRGQLDSFKKHHGKLNAGQITPKDWASKVMNSRTAGRHK